MNAPAPVPNAPQNRGSLLLGVGLAWATLIGGYIIVALLIGAFVGSNDTAWIFALLLPWVGMIALIVFYAQRGQTRTAGGIAIGIASIFAVGLLLVAACFGILTSSGWH
jgi:hypothetical protein